MQPQDINDSVNLADQATTRRPRQRGWREGQRNDLAPIERYCVVPDSKKVSIGIRHQHYRYSGILFALECALSYNCNCFAALRYSVY